MRDIINFNYQDTTVRVVHIGGEPHFVARDVTTALGIANGRDAVSRVDQDGVGIADITDSLGRTQSAAILTESALYELIIQSRVPKAKPFKDWVLKDVLPQIRRTGSYGAPAQLTEDQIVHQALQITARKVEQLEAQVKVLEPKAEAFDGYLSASGDYSINEAAKLLARRGVQSIGQNRLRDHLLAWGWLYRGAKQRLRASQAQVDNGRLAERTSYYYDQVTGEKKAGSSPQPRVTPKGIDAIEKRLALAVVS